MKKLPINLQYITKIHIKELQGYKMVIVVLGIRHSDLEETVCISICINTLEKDNNQSVTQFLGK